MWKKLVLALLFSCVFFSGCQLALEKKQCSEAEGWYCLFDGKSLNGWKASENKGSFTVRDGMIVVNGERSHLFYIGPIENANFKNFEFKADVKTLPGANSGIYLHTAYQETGWPKKGYECQVNNSHKDPKRTGSLYGVENITESAAKDNQWFTQHIIVRGNRIILKTNGKVTVDHTEPKDVTRKDWPGRKLSSGTFALQGHDPDSVVYFKNIMVRPLPPERKRDVRWVPLFNGKSLNGWRQINGSAKYEVKDGAIVGTTAKGSPNSFLCTKKHYRDFELKFEVKVDTRLNSGVQIRSNSFKEYRNGRVHGYQVEIATNGNAGFIYDEARRGWLSKDRSDEKARQAFKEDKWNKYRVVCVGDSIKTWVNGIAVADVVDSMTKSGFIGLQVHGFKGDPPAQVRWRNIRIRDLTGAEPVQKQDKIRVVVITGGHKFEEKEFFSLFEGYDDIEYIEAQQEDDSEIFEDVSGWDYDVMVLFNMTQNISAQRRKNFIKLLKQGVGVVALHHTLGAFQEWDEYREIIGGKYYVKKYLKAAEQDKASGFKHDVDFTVHVEDTTHPITRSMSDFAVHDETYIKCAFEKDNRLLLSTDHPTSDKPVGWVRNYGKAKVFCMQIGHGPGVYRDENYRCLVAQAIRWCAGRLDEN